MVHGIREGMNPEYAVYHRVITTTSLFANKVSDLPLRR